MISQPLFTLRSQEALHSRGQSKVLNAIIKLNIERTPTLFSCQQTTNLVCMAYMVWQAKQDPLSWSSSTSLARRTIQFHFFRMKPSLMGHHLELGLLIFTILRGKLIKFPFLPTTRSSQVEYLLWLVFSSEIMVVRNM